MAARRSRKKNRFRQQQRNVSLISEREKALLRLSDLRAMRIRRERLEITDDRRMFRPALGSPYRDVYGRSARIVADSQPGTDLRGSFLPHRLAFESPARVTVCRRRKQRRAALFARRKIGKGIAGPKRRMMKESSKIKC